MKFYFVSSCVPRNGHRTTSPPRAAALLSLRTPCRGESDGARHAETEKTIGTHSCKRRRKRPGRLPLRFEETHPCTHRIQSIVGRQTGEIWRVDHRTCRLSARPTAVRAQRDVFLRHCTVYLGAVHESLYRAFYCAALLAKLPNCCRCSLHFSVVDRFVPHVAPLRVRYRPHWQPIGCTFVTQMDHSCREPDDRLHRKTLAKPALKVRQCLIC